MISTFCGGGNPDTATLLAGWSRRGMNAEHWSQQGGEKMPKQTITFDIDDALTVNQNIKAFIERIKAFDGPLADILSASLPDISNDVTINQGQLLDSLYAATAPAPDSQTLAAFDGGSDVQ